MNLYLYDRLVGKPLPFTSLAKRRPPRPYPESLGASTAAITETAYGCAHPRVPALVPAAAIVALAEGGWTTVEEARGALGKLKPSIRGDAYAVAIEDLETMHSAKGGKQ